MCVTDIIESEQRAQNYWTGEHRRNESLETLLIFQNCILDGINYYQYKISYEHLDQFRRAMKDLKLATSQYISDSSSFVSFIDDDVIRNQEIVNIQSILSENIKCINYGTEFLKDWDKLIPLETPSNRRLYATSIFSKPTSHVPMTQPQPAMASLNQSRSSYNDEGVNNGTNCPSIQMDSMTTLNTSENTNPLNISGNIKPLNISGNTETLNISVTTEPLNTSGNTEPLNRSGQMIDTPSNRKRQRLKFEAIYCQLEQKFRFAIEDMHISTQLIRDQLKDEMHDLVGELDDLSLSGIPNQFNELLDSAYDMLTKVVNKFSKLSDIDGSFIVYETETSSSLGFDSVDDVTSSSTLVDTNQHSTRSSEQQISEYKSCRDTSVVNDQNTSYQHDVIHVDHIYSCLDSSHTNYNDSQISMIHVDPIYPYYGNMPNSK